MKETIPLRSATIVAAILLIGAIPGSRNGYTQPVADIPGVSIAEVAVIPQTDNQHPVRIKWNPSDETLWVLASSGVVFRLAGGSRGRFNPSVELEQDDHETPEPVGMVIANDGTLYLVGNDDVDPDRTRFVIRRGTRVDGLWSWSTVATSEPYLLSRTWFDHKANGIALSPDQTTLYLNSGARTDHGEQYGGVREEGLTSIVLEIPADAEDILLPNDREALRAGGFLFAEGIRNSFDLEIGPHGDLFGADNAGDRDDTEELNWIREGHHYGFPWRIGTSDTPMQFPGYDPLSDPFVQRDRNTGNGADTGWYFSNDANYPAAPADVVFTDPIHNRGPFADRYREPGTGSVLDAGDQGTSLGSFTPHRSPLGLVFDADSLLDGTLKGGGFAASWNGSDDQLMSRLGGVGEDLLHLDLDKAGGEYVMAVERVAHGFDHPIDTEMVGSTIYVLEYGTPYGSGGRRSVQAVTFPEASGVFTEIPDKVAVEDLHVWPNPSAGAVTIRLSGWTSDLRVELVDLLGRVVASVHRRGAGDVRVATGHLAPGVYFAHVIAGDARLSRTIVVAR